MRIAGFLLFMPRRYARRRRRRSFRRRPFRRSFKRRRTSRRARPNYMFKIRAYMGEHGVQVGGGVQTFQLSDINDASTFTQLYQEYKICAVKWEIIMGNNVNTFDDLTQTHNYLPLLTTAVDYSGSYGTVLPSMLSEYQNTRTQRMQGRITRYLKPRFLVQTYETLTSTGYKPSRGYISTNDPTVPHYALLAYYSSPGVSPGVGTGQSYTQYITYYLKFKGKK